MAPWTRFSGMNLEIPVMPEPAPNPELLRSLGRLVRGLSALFWGLPLTLVVCVQTAKSDWLRPMGIFPPIICTGLLLYGLILLGHFQKQERIWNIALDRAMIFGVINVGLSPFLYWWNKAPGEAFYGAIIYLIMFTGVMFLFTLNPVLWRLAAMLPDEALRAETKLFTGVNRYFLLTTMILTCVYVLLTRVDALPGIIIKVMLFLDQRGLWLALFSLLLPMAMTMALIWKIKEVILSSVFGPEH
jgi:hypothetical protein